MKNTKQNTIYLIGNAHIDPVWLWQWQEGYSEIKATFRSALDRIKEYDDFMFVCAGASYYKWIEDNSPEMFEEITIRVKEGRWQIVGGWWLQPDCNLPSGESFVRHSLYSQRYFKDKFGIIAKTGYNVDSFGHNYMIPQILKKSGMNNYVFMRPGSTELEIPDPLFMWESPDGSQVLAFRILDDRYNNSFRTIKKVISEARDKDNLNTNKLMIFFGVGNHGGGPTIQALDIIKDMQNDVGKDNLFISSPDYFFNDIRKNNLDIPVLKKDLQHHASGCYATHFEFKKKHREVEQLLIATERWNTLTQLIMGYKNESDKLKLAWEEVMFNQFHDIMGGCSIQDSLVDAENALAYAGNISSEVLNGTLQTLSWAIDTSIPGINHSKEKSERIWDNVDKGAPLVVFNPLPFPVKTPVHLDLTVTAVETSDGTRVPVQTVAGRFLINNQNTGTLFIADLPALGYHTYWIHTPSERVKIKLKQFEQKYTLQNDWTRLTIDKNTGLISSLYDKVNNRELIKTCGAQPLIIDEEDSDTWCHGIDTFNNIVGEFKLKSVELIEKGPVRSTIRINSVYNNSQLRQDFSLYSHSPDVDVRLRVNWQEKHKMLKLAFDVNVDNPIATYSSPYGYISKPCDGKEEPGQMWMDLSGTHNGLIQGLALACQARYSYSAQGNSMRLNVVRSPIFAEHESKEIRTEDFEHMDQGIHKLTYKLVSHIDDWCTSGIIQKALCLNNPVQKVHETYHKGPLPLKLENVTVSNPQVIMTVLKNQEDCHANGIIVRFYETLGKVAESQVKIPILNVDTTLSFGAFEIKTLLIHSDGKLVPVNLIELPIDNK